MRVLLILSISFLLFPTDAFAQRGVLQRPGGAGEAGEEEQNETMLDSLKKMRIKREEDEHKKLVGKGEMIKENAQALVKSPPPFDKSKQRDFDKRLKEIEKAARSIRTDSGGYNDTPLDSAPNSTADALKQLETASDRLNVNLAKTNRRVVSVAVLKDTNEIIQLVKLLRAKLP